MDSKLLTRMIQDQDSIKVEFFISLGLKVLTPLSLHGLSNVAPHKWKSVENVKRTCTGSKSPSLEVAFLSPPPFTQSEQFLWPDIHTLKLVRLLHQRIIVNSFH